MEAENQLQKRLEKIIRDTPELTGEEAKMLLSFAKEDKQITRNQHWVPQSYLAKFTGTDGMLQPFDLKKNRLGKRKSPKAVCYDKFFYATWSGKEDKTSQFMEKFFASQEKHFADVIHPEMEKQIWEYGKINELLRFEFSNHIAWLYLRTPYFREKAIGWHRQFTYSMMQGIAWNDEAWEEFKKDYQKEHPEVSDGSIEETRKELCGPYEEASFKINISNEAHLKFFEHADQLRRFLMIKTWTIHLLPESFSERFITSDTPVLEIPPRNWKFGSFHKPGFVDQTHYFAFSPRILIEFSDPFEHDKEVKKVKRKQIKDPYDVHRLNGLRIFDNQSKFAYSDEKKHLALLQKIKKKWDSIPFKGFLKEEGII